MKVIFLDVEGVLNTNETRERVYKKYGYNPLMDLEIDEFRLTYLKEIIDKTEAKVVLCSSLRRFFVKEEDEVLPITLKGKKLYDKLLKYGIQLYDITPVTDDIKEEQIKSWLSTNEDVNSFIIIDDDPLQFDEYQDRLIQTSEKRQNYLLSFMKFSTGLCEEHIDQAEEMLNSKMKTLKR